MQFDVTQVNITTNRIDCLQWKVRRHSSRAPTSLRDANIRNIQSYTGDYLRLVVGWCGVGVVVCSKPVMLTSDIRNVYSDNIPVSSNMENNRWDPRCSSESYKFWRLFM